MAKLRSILLKTQLEESMKWRMPCYTFEGHNVVIVQPFKSYLGLMFFKGALLKDKRKILIKNGPNSQASKRVEFHSVADVTKNAGAIAAYVKEAIALEKAGKKVEFKKQPAAVPPELKQMFSKKPKLKTAFQSLTPGRQRAYLLFFGGAKQAATRQSRIEKYVPRILAGKGMMD